MIQHATALLLFPRDLKLDKDACPHRVTPSAVACAGLREDDTPKSLGMEDYDRIDVTGEQLGD